MPFDVKKEALSIVSLAEWLIDERFEKGIMPIKLQMKDMAQPITD
jgi:hypothetical protein